LYGLSLVDACTVVERETKTGNLLDIVCYKLLWYFTACDPSNRLLGVWDLAFYVGNRTNVIIMHASPPVDSEFVSCQ